jgi:hypothetical protein
MLSFSKWCVDLIISTALIISERLNPIANSCVALAGWSTLLEEFACHLLGCSSLSSALMKARSVAEVDRICVFGIRELVDVQQVVHTFQYAKHALMMNSLVM